MWFIDGNRVDSNFFGAGGASASRKADFFAKSNFGLTIYGE
jgi:hypothetical protein